MAPVEAVQTSARKNLIMGIDVGTTHIKCAVFDIHGNQEAISIKDNIIHYDGNGFSYYKPEDIKNNVLCTINDTISQMEGVRIDIIGIAVTSMAEAGVLVDRYRNSLYPIITWFDNRTKLQSEWWNKMAGSYEIYKKTGLRLQPKYSLNKIMWIKENCRDIYEKAAYWLCMEDYVIYCLSGAVSTDYSIANRTMAMDINSGEWSDELLNTAGIKKSLFPPIYKSGTVVGKVTDRVSMATGLKEGTPVITGGHDHLCAAIALGTVNEGDVFDSTGTAETLVAVKDSIDASREMLESGFSIGRYVAGDRFCIIGGIQNSGGSIEWFGNEFLVKDCSHTKLYDRISDMGVSMNDEPSGIFYVPHLRGSGAPNANPMARGAFIGIKYEHRREDLLKAVYEGVSYELRAMLDRLEVLCDMKITNLKTGGGGTKNALWMKIKANVLGINIDMPCIEESAALGAAMLAGLGAGAYKNIYDAVRMLAVPCRHVEFNKCINSKYETLYNCGYKHLYNMLEPINDILNKF